MTEYEEDAGWYAIWGNSVYFRMTKCCTIAEPQKGTTVQLTGYKLV